MVKQSLLTRGFSSISKCLVPAKYFLRTKSHYSPLCNVSERQLPCYSAFRRYSRLLHENSSLRTQRTCSFPRHVQYASVKSLFLCSSALNSDKSTNLADDILKKRLEPSSGSESSEKEDAEAKKKKDASWKAIKLTFYVFGIGGSSFLIWFVYTSGNPELDPDGNPIPDEFSHMPVVQQYLLRSWKEVKFYNKMIKDPSRDKLLPEPLTEPYYQPPYTLVLEMKGILVHPEWTYSTGWRFKKRPAVEFFLQQVGPPLFEIVIYTSEQGFTAFPIIDALDPQGFVMYRLFRDATRYVDGVHVKDLHCLNRDLSKVIMVDWSDKSVQMNRPNSLVLKKWEGNEDDRSLVELAIMLRTIATSGVGDVREVLHYYQQFDDPIAAFRENQRRAQEQQEEQLRHMQDQKEKGGSLTGSFTSRFFRR